MNPLPQDFLTLAQLARLGQLVKQTPCQLRSKDNGNRR